LSRRSGSRAGPIVPTVDGRWLHALQKATFNYFWRQTNPENGLIPDNTLAATPASIAGVGLALAALPLPAAERQSDWQSGRGFRWRELKVPASGRTFLERLPPAATGITFTNYISEDKGLENSLRTSGAGVAAERNEFIICRSN